MGFTQKEHKLLVIPGPIEMSDAVLEANAHPSMSHVSPAFIPVFGDCLRMLRKVLYAPNSQPILIAGSGTLGWDAVGANLIEQGDNALVLNTGYFGDSFAECLEVYGAKVDQLKAPIGGVPTVDQIKEALGKKSYKVVTFTHVDTSTGVLSPAKLIAETVKSVSPSTLVVLDGVCSVASEEIRFEDWGIDVVVGATQKGLGVPPGLSVVMASQAAIKTLESRKTPPGSYYISWKKWLPIMQAYEAGKPMYFATPPVQLIYSLHEALTTVTERSPSLEERFEIHRQTSQNFKKALTDFGLDQIAVSPETAANGMTAIKYPKGFGASDVLPRLLEKGIVAAGGLHKAMATEYFRVGHMGITVVNTERGDMTKVLEGIKSALTEAGYKGKQQ